MLSLHVFSCFHAAPLLSVLNTMQVWSDEVTVFNTPEALRVGVSSSASAGRPISQRAEQPTADTSGLLIGALIREASGAGGRRTAAAAASLSARLQRSGRDHVHACVRVSEQSRAERNRCREAERPQEYPVALQGAR